MISELLTFFDFWSFLLLFICHSVTFACSLYIAVHNRELKPWVITPLWYLGICSAFAGLTIVIEWALGPDHPISYSNIGILGETAFQIILALIMFLTFLDTVKTDLKNKKHRQK